MKEQRGNKNGLRAKIRSWLLGPVSQAYSLGVYNNGIDAGVNVNSDTALRYTAVFAAIKILAENIAGLPLSVLRKNDDDGYESDHQHPAYKVISHPNDYTDSYTFWFTIVGWLEGKGNAFAVIRTDKGRPVALHQVNPDWVTIVFANGEKTYVVKSGDPDYSFLDGTYLDYEMLHFMLFTRDGIIGVDPIAYNAAAIGEGIAAQKFTSDFFRTGGMIKGTLETDGSLGDEAYEQFMKHYHAASGNYGTPLLEYGIKYKAISISPEASQLLQSKTFSVNDIARIFTIPPHLLAELSHATFSNIEQQNIFFGEYTLRPICKRMETQLEAKLFLASEAGNYRVKFDLRGLMRGDDKTRAEYYEKGINAGWMTPNEARLYENIGILPGLDAPRIPLNYKTISPDEDAEKTLLAEKLGVGGTQALVSIMENEMLTDDQKKGLLAILFDFSDEELATIFKT